MAEPFGGLGRFLRELKRRSVYRVAVTYAVVAFVTLQAAQLVFPATTLEGVYDVLVLLAFVGFPIALVLAWAFEMTPEGVRRTPEAAEEDRDVEGAPAHGAEEPPRSPGSESSLALKGLVGLGLLAVAGVAGWYLVGGGGETEPRAGDRSIAVLPFENMGGEESEQFTMGVHDGLLTRLSNVSGLRVISRTSVMQFEDSRLPLPAIADSLGVKWVMEGGVQKMGDQLQVNAQLIDPRTDTHAWAEQYRRDLTATDLFAIQSDITKRIARSLEARLTPEEERRVERRPTENLEAYRLYVRGRNRLALRTVESIGEARDYFERALREDSTYALAWAGLADALVLRAAWGSGSFDDFIERMEEAIPEARAAASRARELDPDLAEAWTALGAIHVYEQGAGLARDNGPSALEELRRAVELKPSYAHAQQWLGELYLRLGRPDRGLEHASLAVELNPRHAAAREVLIWALLAQGRAEEARRHFERYPHDYPWFDEALVLHHTERWDELDRLARERLEDRDGDCPECRFHLARISVSRGDTAGAREQLAAIRRRDSSDSRYFWEGLVHAALGQHDAAFETWLDVGEWGWGSSSLLLRYYYPDVLDPLRDDPRYRGLIQRLNRAWGLSPDGSLPDSVDVSFGAQPDE